MKFQQEVESAEETQTKKSLTQIGLGMNGYEVRHGGFPTNSYDAGGNPLLSWRVHILPFIDQEPLYKRFKLNEPWDSPNNKLLLNNIPQFYMSPSEALGKKNKGNSTYFRAFSSAGSLMDPKFRKIGRLGVEIGPSYREVDSGWSRIVLVVESGEAVEWTKPDDLSWSGGALLPPLGGEQKNPAKNWMLFGDLSVRAVGKSLTPGQLQAAIVITGRHDFDLP